MRLHEMIGESLWGLVPSFENIEGGPHITFKLLAVDVGGIWVESQSYTEMILKRGKRQDAPRTPVFFLPYSSISYLTRMHEVPALSSTSLGLEPR